MKREKLVKCCLTAGMCAPLLMCGLYLEDMGVTMATIIILCLCAVSVTCAAICTKRYGK